jgi:acyl dehydratase
MSDTRSPDGLLWFDYETIQAPDDLGSMEFTPTPEMWKRYEKLSGNPESVFITLALRPMTLLHTKYAFRPGESPINAGHEAEYFNRPLPGKKLIVTGRIKEKYMRRDRPYVVLEFDVKDEDGRPIERMRRITMNRASSLGRKWWARSPKDAEVGAEIAPLVKAITLESMREAEAIAAINPLANNTNIHNDAETAARAGLREPLASANEMTNHFHELLTNFAGPDWVKGGTISLRYTRPVLAGDRITYRGVVEKKVPEGDRTRLVLKIWSEKPAGQVGIGSASLLA